MLVARPGQIDAHPAGNQPGADTASGRCSRYCFAAKGTTGARKSCFTTKPEGGREQGTRRRTTRWRGRRAGAVEGFAFSLEG